MRNEGAGQTRTLWGSATGHPWLAFAIAVFVFRQARLVLGALPAQPPQWREDVATSLDRLPFLYVPVLVVSVGCSAVLVLRQPESPGAMIGYGLSLRMTLLLATCVAHELFHRRDRRLARLGHALAGFCGYPLLGAEREAVRAAPGAAEGAVEKVQRAAAKIEEAAEQSGSSAPPANEGVTRVQIERPHFVVSGAPMRIVANGLRELLVRRGPQRRPKVRARPEHAQCTVVPCRPSVPGRAQKGLTRTAPPAGPAIQAASVGRAKRRQPGEPGARDTLVLSFVPIKM